MTNPSQDDLDTLNRAIYSGTLSVRTSDGKTVTYRSLAEMLAARNALEEALGLGRRPRFRVQTHSIKMRGS